jgi:hypothetical protein
MERLCLAGTQTYCYNTAELRTFKAKLNKKILSKFFEIVTQVKRLGTKDESSEPKNVSKSF